MSESEGRAPEAEENKKRKERRETATKLREAMAKKEGEEVFQFRGLKRGNGPLVQLG